MIRNASRTSIPLALVAALLLSACSEQVAAVDLDRSTVLALFGREHHDPKPAASAELIALGRDLYHETRLSTKDNISCASCHDLNRYGVDGEATSPGADGVRGDRNSPTSLNAHRQFAQFWDGRAADVEAQAQGPVLNPVEHGYGSEDDFVAKLASVPGIAERMQQIFGGDQPVSLANFGAAVGAFERTLTTRSRFDDYLDGNDDALSVGEKRGLATFLEVGCAACHLGRTLGGGMYQKLGLVKPYGTPDVGRAKISGNEAEKHFFKVPMLLNVAKTAPYLHDGSIKSLPEAVKLMGEYQLGRNLSDDQVAAIVSFLEALTGELPK
jgi:cytochrome c peroxidase